MIDLAAAEGIFLVILCSRQTKPEHLAERVATTPGAKALIVNVPADDQRPRFPSRTSHPDFRRASAGRDSDLSVKRNIGLLLARLHGWRKIAFVDDDMSFARPDNILRMAGQLENHQVAGMIVREYPDNSVVCHARRLAGFDQDVFVTGAVLGVHTGDQPLPYFPDVYNEDWFFFAHLAARRELPHVGEATQAEYDPFARPRRARREEFGDLLAEGLYSLLEDEDPDVRLTEQLRGATTSYWSRFIEARKSLLAETSDRLRGFLRADHGNTTVQAALASLRAAEEQLQSIDPDLCVAFLNAWQQDVADWQDATSDLNDLGSTMLAMEYLGLDEWRFAEFGLPKLAPPPPIHADR
jgi:hypothetical protein